ncbi:hypothetical protein ABZ958_38090 [Streptomyces sp. NPDC046237]|uniref:hypothetical protein n=1 Tax=Streptomyces sp. NPDC046237 TaxID=3154914 RepID=UPI0033C74C07
MITPIRTAGRREAGGDRHDGAADLAGVLRGGGSLDLTAERLRHLRDAFTKAADDSRARTDRYAEQDGADAVRPVRQDDQQVHRSQEPGPHRGREAGH